MPTICVDVDEDLYDLFWRFKNDLYESGTPNHAEALEYLLTLWDAYGQPANGIDRIRRDGLEPDLDVPSGWILAFPRAFARKHDLDEDDLLPTQRKIDEEIDELDDALEVGREAEILEESVDVVFVLILRSILVDQDFRTAFVEKSYHNLRKSGERDEHGMVVDDVGQGAP